MALSLNDFGKAVVAAGLLPADDLKAVFASSAADARPKDAAALAKVLVEQGSITRHQADELLAGRGEDLVLGDYIIQDKIGAGGMGQVLKAVHRKMGRAVALKLMSTSAMRDEAAIKRFHREVKAAARLEHENIVTAHAAGEARGMHYLVMQYVEGRDLSGRVKKEGPMTIDLAMDCICQSARGLAYAHSEGIIHRDIKPANLLLDKRGIVKILDMGLARIDGGDAHDGLTGTEQVLGTVDYMSPEQAISTRDCDARADIYSLGCTLWYLLTATKMYAGDSPIQRLMQHREAPLPSLLAARDDIPWALEKLFHKMVAKKPDDRIQTMDEVVREIEQIRGGPESSRTSGLEEDTNLGQFAITVGGKESSRSGTKVKVAAGKSSATEESTVGQGDSLKVPMTSGVRNPPWKNPKVLAGAGAAVFLLLLLGVWIIVRDKDGNEIARIEAPNGSTVEVKPNPAKPEPTKPAKEESPFKVGSAITLPETSKPKTPESASAADVSWPFDQKDGREYIWSEPENLGPKVNDTDKNRYPTLSADQLCLIAEKAAAGGSDLFEFRRKNVIEPWGEPTQLQGTDLEESCSISADGLTLIYASNDAKVLGHQGRYDLCVRRRANRDAPWGPPQNLGLTVNSDADDDAPSLSPDGLALVFSSNREGGIGGRDLWITRRAKTDAPWGPPQNLGNKINATGGENSALFLADGKNLLFERNREFYITVADSAGNLSAKKLPKQGFQYSFPWLSPDGQTMYFHATLPGGQGNDDIWVTRRVPKNPAEALTYGGHRYLLVNDPGTWVEAKAKAEAMGGHLVAITSKEERDWVLENIWLKRPKDIDRFFLGCSAPKKDGPWTWITGEPFDMAVWLGKGPNDGTDGPKAATWSANTGWDDVGTTSKYKSFLVEWDTLGPTMDVVYLDDLPETKWEGLRFLGKHGLNADRSAISWNGKQPPHALFTHPTNDSSAAVSYALESKFDEFRATMGLVKKPGTPLTFRVWGDDKQLWESSPQKVEQKGTEFQLSVRNVKVLKLEVFCPGDCNSAHAVWIEPRLTPVAAATTASTTNLQSPIVNPQSLYDLLTSSDYEWTTPENLGPKVNGDKGDWAPALSTDGLCLVFASSREERNGDLYECRRKTLAESFGEPVAIPATLSASMDVDPWLSADGLTLLFATTNGHAGAQGGYDIYISRRQNRDAPWSKPENLGPTVNTDKTEAGPCLSPDGLTLYFHSNRVGTTAGKNTDIWLSRRKALDAPWETPVNLGVPINTGSTEAQPYLASDGRTLLTVRDLGGGKTELRVSQLGSDGKWTKHLFEVPSDGEPTRNDRYPFLAADGRTLYFTSARKGGLGGDDLWLTRRVPKKQEPAVSTADPERRAAEWVLSLGGRASVIEPGKMPVSISSAAALPKGPFLVRTVTLPMTDTTIRDDDLACLASLAELQDLDFGRVKGYTDAGLKHLSRLVNLKKLVFYDNSQITDSGMKHLASLKKLEDLGLVATQVSDQGLREFIGCPLLRLNVGGRPKADKMMPVIEEFRDLLDLGLHGKVITNNNVQGLQSLTKLQHLALMGSSVTDEGLKTVATLKVKNLHLQGPKFTDAGIKNIEGMTSLTKLSIRDTKVTAAGIDAMQKALPECQIAWDDPAKAKSAAPADK